MNIKAIARFVRFEKAAGRAGNLVSATMAANHVARACRLYGVTRNPY